MKCCGMAIDRDYLWRISYTRDRWVCRLEVAICDFKPGRELADEKFVRKNLVKGSVQSNNFAEKQVEIFKVEKIVLRQCVYRECETRTERKPDARTVKKPNEGQ